MYCIVGYVRQGPGFRVASMLLNVLLVTMFDFGKLFVTEHHERTQYT